MILNGEPLEEVDCFKYLGSQVAEDGGCERDVVFIIIIIIKRGRQCKAGKERLTPHQSEDPNPTTPTHRKKEEKGKTVGDKKGASS